MSYWSCWLFDFIHLIVVILNMQTIFLVFIGKFNSWSWCLSESYWSSVALTVSVVKQNIFFYVKLDTGISCFLLNNFILFQSKHYDALAKL